MMPCGCCATSRSRRRRTGTGRKICGWTGGRTGMEYRWMKRLSRFCSSICCGGRRDRPWVTSRAGGRCCGAQRASCCAMGRLHSRTAGKKMPDSHLSLWRQRSQRCWPLPTWPILSGRARWQPTCGRQRIPGMTMSSAGRTPWEMMFASSWAWMATTCELHRRRLSALPRLCWGLYPSRIVRRV